MDYHFEATLQRFDSKLWGHHFMLPSEIGAQLSNNQVSRVICHIGTDTMFHCGLMPAGDGAYFINVNQEIRDRCNWDIGQKRPIHLIRDESTYGMPMPIEFEEALRLDPEGDEIFHQLTPGKQRTLIYMTAKPKRSDTRLKKCIIILDYLKEVHGALDYKELNQAFKDRKDDF